MSLLILLLHLKISFSCLYSSTKPFKSLFGHNTFSRKFHINHFFFPFFLFFITLLKGKINIVDSKSRGTRMQFKKLLEKFRTKNYVSTINLEFRLLHIKHYDFCKIKLGIFKNCQEINISKWNFKKFLKNMPIF